MAKDQGPNVTDGLDTSQKSSKYCRVIVTSANIVG